MKFKRARSDDQIELRKKEILNACKKLLMEKGYDDTTLLSISSLISVGRTTIYNYYPTKEDLFMELCTYETESLIKEMKDAYNKADKNKIYDEFKTMLMNVFKNYKYLFQYYAIYISKVMGKAKKENVDTFRKNISTPFKEYFRKWLLLVKPSISDEEVKRFNNVLWVFFTGINTLAYSEKVYEETCEAYVDGTILLLKK